MPKVTYNGIIYYVGTKAQILADLENIPDNALIITTDEPPKENLSDFLDDTTHRLVTDTEKSDWNAKSSVSINNSKTTSAYAPTSGGTSGYELVAYSSASAPVWKQPSGYLSCSTAASTTAKTATCTNFKLTTGVRITVKFTYAHTGSTAPTLNIASTGAKAMYWGNNDTNKVQITKDNSWQAGDLLTFVYSGSYWYCIGGDFKAVYSGSNLTSVWYQGNTYTISGGGGEPTEYIKSISVSGNTITITKKDGTTTTYTPTIPTVNNSTITIYQGGVSKGSFTLNQGSAKSIYLDAGGGGSSGITGVAVDEDTKYFDLFSYYSDDDVFMFFEYKDSYGDKQRIPFSYMTGNAEFIFAKVTNNSLVSIMCDSTNGWGSVTETPIGGGGGGNAYKHNIKITLSGGDGTGVLKGVFYSYDSSTPCEDITELIVLLSGEALDITFGNINDYTTNQICEGVNNITFDETENRIYVECWGGQYIDTYALSMSCLTNCDVSDIVETVNIN